MHMRFGFFLAVGLALIAVRGEATVGSLPPCLLPGTAYRSIATGEWLGIWLGVDNRLAVFKCPTPELLEAGDFPDSRLLVVDHRIRGFQVVANDCTLQVDEYGDVEKPYWDITIRQFVDSMMKEFALTVQTTDAPRFVHADELSTAFVDNVRCRALTLRSNRHLPESHKY